VSEDVSNLDGLYINLCSCTVASFILLSMKSSADQFLSLVEPATELLFACMVHEHIFISSLGN
jgi:hypothetical protein